MALETVGNCVLKQKVLSSCDEIVLLNDPLMVYMEDKILDDSTLLADSPYGRSCETDKVNFHKYVMDSNFLDVESGLYSNGNLSACFTKDEEISVPYQIPQNSVQNVLDSLQDSGNNTTQDLPDFVDVSNLTDIFENNNSPRKNCVMVSDGEDDVIFVREYKDAEEPTVATLTRKCGTKKSYTVRRNPVRRARSAKISKDVAAEHLFEDELAFLDDSDEDRMVVNEKNASSTNENYKKWPINVHERPEYNAVTEKIEKFDYTIREIQNSLPKKKPKIEHAPVRRKVKKMYFGRRNKPRKVIEEKIAVQKLKEVVEGTVDLMKDFCKNCKELNAIGKTLNVGEFKDKNTINGLVKNQVILLSVVNDLPSSEIVEKLEELHLPMSE